MQKEKWDILNPDYYLTLLLFEDDKLPEVYLIPATAWKTPDELLCDKNYDGLKSKPEYGLNLSKKNRLLLEEFKIEAILMSLY